ncbi:GIP [Symbiodinium sp. CCMP2592]|nr:GIP [Symbiodinium sp. CCMP2592]
MLGHTPRTNGELMSDDLVDPGPVLLDAGRRGHEQTTDGETGAAEGVCGGQHVECGEGRTVRSKGRTQRNFQPGEVVFVWRSWQSQGVLKPGWVGPAVVLMPMPEGPNVCERSGANLEGVERASSAGDFRRDTRHRGSAFVIFNSAKVIEDHTSGPVPDDVVARRLEPNVEPNVEEEGLFRYLQFLLRQISLSSEPEREVAHHKHPGIAESGEQRFSDQLRAAMDSAYKNDILDDALPRRKARVQQEGQSRPMREKEDQKIYFAQDTFFEEETLDEFVADFRRTPPQQCKRTEIIGSYCQEPEYFGATVSSGGGDQDSEEDDWRAMRPSKKAAGKWKGHTDFFLTKQTAKNVLEHQVRENSIPPDEWEGWRQTDAEERAKIQVSGAVRVLSAEESKKVIAQLSMEGKEDRIMSSRLVRRNKPSEQPNEPAQKKSRLVIRGFEDPDACGLDRCLEEGQIMEILHGLSDGRSTVRQSRLDPCVFVLYIGGVINGVIVVEVDDLLCFGLKEEELRLQKLREKFAFGKFLWLQDLPQGISYTSFNGRIRHEKDYYSLKVDMCKFVTESMSEVRLERGRRSQPEAEATAKEKRNTRAAIGSLAWAAKEGRPDAAAGASILASKIAKLKVRLWGQTAKCALLWWKSAKLRRKVPSTLAAETQTLNRGLGELLWTKALWQNFLDEDFDLQMFMASIKKQADLVLQKADADRLLRESLSIADAKSVYDNVVAIARERKDGLGAQMKWVEHQSMVVDALTKVGANPQALHRLLDSGHYRVVAEHDQLDERCHRECKASLSHRSLKRILGADKHVPVP